MAGRTSFAQWRFQRGRIVTARRVEEEEEVQLLRVGARLSRCTSALCELIECRIARPTISRHGSHEEGAKKSASSEAALSRPTSDKPLFVPPQRRVRLVEARRNLCAAAAGHL